MATPSRIKKVQYKNMHIVSVKSMIKFLASRIQLNSVLGSLVQYSTGVTPHP